MKKMKNKRKLKSFKVEGKNSLNFWWKFKNPLIVAFNFLIIWTCKYLPSLALKRFLLRLTGMKIGKEVAIGLGVNFDIFNPELITLEDNCLIGFNVTIITHEFLIKELRIGEVVIGKNVLIGANSTILPGIKIGDNAVVSACSFVNKDVRLGAFVGGVPAKELRRRER